MNPYKYFPLDLSCPTGWTANDVAVHRVDVALDAALYRHVCIHRGHTPLDVTADGNLAVVALDLAGHGPLYSHITVHVIDFFCGLALDRGDGAADRPHVTVDDDVDRREQACPVGPGALDDTDDDAVAVDLAVADRQTWAGVVHAVDDQRTVDVGNLDIPGYVADHCLCIIVKDLIPTLVCHGVTNVVCIANVPHSNVSALTGGNVDMADVANATNIADGNVATGVCDVLRCSPAVTVRASVTTYKG